jgi:tetratricopeptide (TPR) repeat protein
MGLQLRLDNAEDLNEKIRIAREFPKREREFTLLEIYLEHKRWDEAEKLMASSEFFDPRFWLVCFPWEAMYGPPYSYKFTALLFSVKGVIAYHKGDKSKARELFEEALKLYEKPLSLFTPFGANGVLTPKAYLGMIYYEEGKEELARKYLKEAFSKNVPFLGDDEAKPVAQKLGISVR